MYKHIVNTAKLQQFTTLGEDMRFKDATAHSQQYLVF